MQKIISSALMGQQYQAFPSAVLHKLDPQYFNEKKCQEIDPVYKEAKKPKGFFYWILHPIQAIKKLLGWGPKETSLEQSFEKGPHTLLLTSIGGRNHDLVLERALLAYSKQKPELASLALVNLFKMRDFAAAQKIYNRVKNLGQTRDLAAQLLTDPQKLAQAELEALISYKDQFNDVDLLDTGEKNKMRREELMILDHLIADRMGLTANKPEDLDKAEEMIFQTALQRPQYTMKLYHFMKRYKRDIEHIKSQLHKLVKANPNDLTAHYELAVAIFNKPSNRRGPKFDPDIDFKDRSQISDEDFALGEACLKRAHELELQKAPKELLAPRLKPASSKQETQKDKEIKEPKDTAVIMSTQKTFYYKKFLNLYKNGEGAVEAARRAYAAQSHRRHHYGVIEELLKQGQREEADQEFKKLVDDIYVTEKGTKEEPFLFSGIGKQKLVPIRNGMEYVTLKQPDHSLYHVAKWVKREKHTTPLMQEFMAKHINNTGEISRRMKPYEEVEKDHREHIRGELAA